MMKWFGYYVRGIGSVEHQMNGLGPVSIIYSNTNDISVIFVGVKFAVINIFDGGDSFYLFNPIQTEVTRGSLQTKDRRLEW